MSHRVFIIAATIFAACGGSSGGATNVPCSGDETRCDGDKFQTCNGEVFETAETCAGSTVCDPTIGCAGCTPAGGTACDGDDVRTCDADGNLGDVVETCNPGECSGGSCGSGFGCSAAGVELIYVVDVDNTLLSFDPEKLGTADDPFTIIGTLSCPAGPAWPARGGGTATPFSMSVDRDATAWVLYDSGEIFHVSTEDASCQATTFAKGQSGFELFGMGFASDTPDGEAETLFITGGDAGTTEAGNLGDIDTATLTVTSRGSLPAATFGPEMTGTGDAKLYGYYPGVNSFIAEIDKTSGQSLQTYPLDSGGLPEAWAFAHYGGKFYVFVTIGGLGGSESQVIEFDPAGPSETVVVSDSPHTIVGAGVSTCAPIQVD